MRHALTVVAVGAAAGGPYAFGNSLSAADVVFAPVIQRLHLAAQCRGLVLPTAGGCATFCHYGSELLEGAWDTLQSILPRDDDLLRAVEATARVRRRAVTCSCCRGALVPSRGVLLR
jgi:glutathione S-transferase